MNEVGLILYSSADVPKATEFFTALLGSEPYVASKQYVGFKTGDVEIGLVQQYDGVPPALAYVTVGDIKAALATLLAAGAQTLQDVRDVGGGMLVASIKNPDGTPIGLRQFPKP